MVGAQAVPAAFAVECFVASAEPARGTGSESPRSSRMMGLAAPSLSGDTHRIIRSTHAGIRHVRHGPTRSTLLEVSARNYLVTKLLTFNGSNTAGCVSF